MNLYHRSGLNFSIDIVLKIENKLFCQPMWFKYANSLHYSSLPFKYYFQTFGTCPFTKLHNTVCNTRSGHTHKKTHQRTNSFRSAGLQECSGSNVSRKLGWWHKFSTSALAEAAGICYRMQSFLYHSLQQSSALLPHTSSALSWDVLFTYLHTVMQTESLI